jgi:carbon storage regulator
LLTLKRRNEESILIGDDIEVTVVTGGPVTLAVVAPKHVKIFRKEVFQEMQKQAALKSSQEAVKQGD